MHDPGLTCPGSTTAGAIHPLSQLEQGAVQVALLAGPLATRRAHAGAYRSFCGWLRSIHGGEMPSEFTVTELRGYREWLRSARIDPSAIDARLVMLRRLAAYLELDPAIQRVPAGCAASAPGRALAHHELSRLLSLPDLGTARGRRDAGLLLLVSVCGLRTHEAIRVRVGDIRREPSRCTREQMRALAALHPAGAPRRIDTGSALIVRDAGQREVRALPLTAYALGALERWREVRPPSNSDGLLLSMPRNGGRPATLTPRQVRRILAAYGRRAGLAEELTVTVLQRSFCTLLADAGVRREVICSLAGHTSTRTTQRWCSAGPSDC